MQTQLKNISYLLFVSLISTNSFSQNFSWAHQWGGWTYDYGNSVTTDADGNVYTTGNFADSADFDDGPGESKLIANGDDAFITKHDPQGNLLWAKQLDAGPYGYASSIEADDDGAIYVAGLFYGVSDFDPGAGTFMMDALLGDGRAFICKLDTDGDFIWARQFGGAANPTDLVVDNDYVYTAGNFNHIGDFDPGVGSALLDGGSSSMFVAKFDEDGNYIWATHFAKDTLNDTLFTSMESIAVDEDGNVYTTGGFEDTVDFDPGVGTVELNPQYVDIFLSKLDADGNFVWVKQFGTDGYDIGTAVVVQNTAMDIYIYTIGFFSGLVDFDPGAGVSTLESGYYDGVVGGYAGNLYIAKYDSNGDHIWSKGMIGTGEVTGTEIELDNFGNIYTAGYFEHTIDFDPGIGVQLATTTGPYFYGHDIFYAKLDNTGDLLWSETFGSSYHDRVYDLVVDNDYNVYLTGIFEDVIDFDAGPGVWELAEYNTFSETPDVFVMKLSVCEPAQSLETITGLCNEDYTWHVNGESYQSSGIYKYVLESTTGCDSIITLDLEIPPVSPDVEIENIAGVLTYSNAQPGETYQWMDCATNQVIVGETQATFIPPYNGSFSLIATSGTCVLSSDCLPFISTVGLVEHDASDIQLFPNPVEDQFTILTSDNSPLLSVEISSMNGQIIAHVQNPKNTFSTGDWQSGVYLVKIVTETGSNTIRLVKK